VVLDEADLVEDALMSFIGVNIPTYILRKLKLTMLPPVTNPIRQKKLATGLNTHCPKLKAEYKDLPVASISMPGLFGNLESWSV
jgi:hypothetical protein